MTTYNYFELLYGSTIILKQYHFILYLFVIILFIELPYHLIIMLSTIKASFYKINGLNNDSTLPYYPKISCIIPCYSEGDGVKYSIQSIVEQIYPGIIEVLVVVDGVQHNESTYYAARKVAKLYADKSNRKVLVVPKYIRGGKVSSLNLGLQLAKGEYIMVLDGETSCDNTSIQKAVMLFYNKHIIGISGAVRVRNARKNLVTNLQNLEYILGINLARYGLSAINSLNIISGAFGFFRKKWLQQLGGWRTGSGEDLDLTIRIQSIFSRYKNLKLIHSSSLVSHTDVPDTWRSLLRQRIRWDGDMFYIWIKRYKRRLVPSFMKILPSIILLWGGILFNLVVPLLILIYIPYIFIHYQINFIVYLLILTYSYYFIISCINYLIFIILVSERKSQDIQIMPYLLIIPFYQFLLRIWTAVAITYEVVLSTHKYSSMAPWWVLKKRV